MGKKLLSSAIALSLIFGMTNYELSTGKKDKSHNYERPKGYEHSHKSEEKKLSHKLHQKKIKARRKAKKGIYDNKFKYPKKRY